MSTAILDAPPVILWPTHRLVKAEELMNHPEWGPCELVRGKVIPVCRPLNEHGLLVHRMSVRVGNFVEKHNLGRCFTGDSGVFLERDPDTVRGPDFHFVRADRWPGKEALKSYLTVAPDLCVEIISLNDNHKDLEQKISEYQAFGVKRVWVIDPKSCTARVYRGDVKRPEIIPAAGSLSGEDILPGFELTLKDLFAALD